VSLRVWNISSNKKTPFHISIIHLSSYPFPSLRYFDYSKRGTSRDSPPTCSFMQISMAAIVKMPWFGGSFNDTPDVNRRMKRKGSTTALNSFSFLSFFHFSLLSIWFLFLFLSPFLFFVFVSSCLVILTEELALDSGIIYIYRYQ
jgi:hypothetical protein